MTFCLVELISVQPFFNHIKKASSTNHVPGFFNQFFVLCRYLASPLESAMEDILQQGAWPRHGLVPTTLKLLAGIGDQLALSLYIWHIPIKGSVIAYSCESTAVVSHEYSVLSTGFNNCQPYFKEESKITRDLAAQCSLFTSKKQHSKHMSTF